MFMKEAIAKYESAFVFGNSLFQLSNHLLRKCAYDRIQERTQGFCFYKRERLPSEQLAVLHEKFSTEKGWKQDVSNPL
ncbi:hypothetical protein SDC9_04733 [bioreactor metagenome]|uniref:Uncharacterized protein n=2 Tax=root TaxID=1 RepID=A0A098B343_DESHA|nr:Hypothetical protein DPCES_3413 [Desulfitobacterium hafniense]